MENLQLLVNLLVKMYESIKLEAHLVFFQGGGSLWPLICILKHTCISNYEVSHIWFRTLF